MDRFVSSQTRSGDRAQPATSFAPVIPFVFQFGERLLMLEPEGHEWVLAEMRFDPETCRYWELRRMRYASEREAIGSLLSRAYAGGEHALAETALQIREWRMTFPTVA